MKIINSTRGAVFITAIVISLLMILIAVAGSNMMMQDIHMVRHLRQTTQAHYLAEAGISHALAWLNENGFSAFDPATFSLTPPEESGLGGWLDELGLPCVGRVMRMVRGPLPQTDAAVQVFSLTTQALG